MPETTLGLEYPDSLAHTRTWEHWQTLAQTADAAITDQINALAAAVGIAEIRTGAYTLASLATGTSQNTVVTYSTPMSAAPHWIGVTPHNSRLTTAVTAYNATTATVGISNWSGGAMSVSGSIRWIAVRLRA